MLKIQRFVCNPLQENTYVVSDETRECVIVDCGAFFDNERAAIADYVERQGLKPVGLWVTHGHLDHNIGNRWLFEVYGLKPWVHSGDRELMETLPQQCLQFMGTPLTDQPPQVGRWLEADDELTVGNHTFKVVETPGHTPGGVFLYCEAEEVAFSGDTLFRGSIGRTDLPGGSMFRLIQSLRRICQLPDATRVLSGHGPETTIGFEVASNPYLDR